jgi:SAM-dependent methyltransferase
VDAQAIERRRQEIVAKSGPWTGHNFLLARGVYTMGSEKPEPVPGYPVGGAPDDLKLRRIVQIVSDISHKPIDRLRVLDLGCLEGLYSVELASRGARVVAVDARAENVDKTEFAFRTRALANADVFQDDVRNLGPDRYGAFDVVLCLGLLYHLDAPDVFALLESMAAVCDRLTIIDTHISVRPVERRRHGGVDYWGRIDEEHRPVSKEGGELWPLWQGIGNRLSFALTRTSLMNAIKNAGFSSAYECHVPPEPGKERSRITVVALKAERQPLISTPRVNSLVWHDTAETPPFRTAVVLARVKRALPPALRWRLVRMAGRIRLRLRAPRFGNRAT